MARCQRISIRLRQGRVRACKTMRRGTLSTHMGWKSTIRDPSGFFIPAATQKRGRAIDIYSPFGEPSSDMEKTKMRNLPAATIAVSSTSGMSAPIPVVQNPYEFRKQSTVSGHQSVHSASNTNGHSKDRDPYKMNQHLKLSFSEIIGEPAPGTYSFDRVWKLSRQTFSVTKLWCYRILSLLCALPCAVFWAISFACLAFCHIWCCAPCLRAFRIQLRYVREMYDILMSTFVAPCMDAVGRCFSHIRVKVGNEEDSDMRERIQDI